MFAKSFFASALLATGALAAPTVSQSTSAELDKRAAWQTGKCEAHIFVDVGGEYIRGYDLHWTVNVIDNPGNQIGHAENIKNWYNDNRDVQTSKGQAFKIRGQPQDDLSGPDGKQGDALTLTYGDQVWNSKDCYKYTFLWKGYHESKKDQHNWWCQFDC